MHFLWCDMKRTLYILMLFLYFSNEDSMMLNVLLRKLHYISGLNELISQTCDTSFLYWHRQLIPVYFDYFFESKVEAYRLNVSLTASLILTFARSYCALTPFLLCSIYWGHCGIALYPLEKSSIWSLQQKSCKNPTARKSRTGSLKRYLSSKSSWFMQVIINAWHSFFSPFFRPHFLLRSLPSRQYFFSLFHPSIIHIVSKESL